MSEINDFPKTNVQHELFRSESYGSSAADVVDNWCHDVLCGGDEVDDLVVDQIQDDLEEKNDFGSLDRRDDEDMEFSLDTGLDDIEIEEDLSMNSHKSVQMYK